MYVCDIQAAWVVDSVELERDGRWMWFPSGRTANYLP